MPGSPDKEIGQQVDQVFEDLGELTEQQRDLGQLYEDDERIEAALLAGLDELHKIRRALEDDAEAVPVALRAWWLEHYPKRAEALREMAVEYTAIGALLEEADTGADQEA
jgi:hypothetical protein